MAKWGKRTELLIYVSALFVGGWVGVFFFSCEFFLLDSPSGKITSTNQWLRKKHVWEHRHYSRTGTPGIRGTGGGGRVWVCVWWFRARMEHQYLSVALRRRHLEPNGSDN